MYIQCSQQNFQNFTTKWEWLKAYKLIIYTRNAQTKPVQVISFWWFSTAHYDIDLESHCFGYEYSNFYFLWKQERKQLAGVSRSQNWHMEEETALRNYEVVLNFVLILIRCIVVMKSIFLHLKGTYMLHVGINVWKKL